MQKNIRSKGKTSESVGRQEKASGSHERGVEVVEEGERGWARTRK